MTKRAPGYAARKANVLPQQRAAYREGKLTAVKARERTQKEPRRRYMKEEMEAEMIRRRSQKSTYSNR